MAQAQNDVTVENNKLRKSNQLSEGLVNILGAVERNLGRIDLNLTEIGTGITHLQEVSVRAHACETVLRQQRVAPFGSLFCILLSFPLP